MNRTASCSCGQFEVRVTGDPFMQGICSCTECQRLTGSAFYHHGYWPKSAVSISGDSKSWRRITDAGRWVESCFCPVCGSSVYALSQFEADAICVSVGSFADPHFPPPQYSVWQRSKHDWVTIPAGCESLDTQP